MARQQGEDFVLHFRVWRSFADPRGTLDAGDVQRIFEDFADDFPALRIHVGRASSRCSHASARRCSRPMVATETPSA